MFSLYEYDGIQGSLYSVVLDIQRDVQHLHLLLWAYDPHFGNCKLDAALDSSGAEGTR